MQTLLPIAEKIAIWAQVCKKIVLYVVLRNALSQLRYKLLTVKQSVLKRLKRKAGHSVMKILIFCLFCFNLSLYGSEPIVVKLPEDFQKLGMPAEIDTSNDDKTFNSIKRYILSYSKRRKSNADLTGDVAVHIFMMKLALKHKYVFSDNFFDMCLSTTKDQFVIEKEFLPLLREGLKNEAMGVCVYSALKLAALKDTQSLEGILSLLSQELSQSERTILVIALKDLGYDIPFDAKSK